MPSHLGPSRREAEELLDGAQRGSDSLRRLLARAQAGEAPADTAGLAHALAELSSQARQPVVVAARSGRSVLRAAFARMAAAKMLVIAAFAVLATGGIALAATTGAIPNPLPGPAHGTTATTAASTWASEDSPATLLHPSSTPVTPATAVTGSGPADPSPSGSGPSPSLTGLCTSWLARPHTNGKADESAAFSVLVAAAGSEDAVDGYCTALLGGATPSESTPAPAETTGTPGTPGTPAGKKTHSNGKVTGKGS